MVGEMNGITKEPILLPSLDITRPYEPTIYMDEESIMEDMSKTVHIAIGLAVIIHIIKEINKNEPQPIQEV